MVYQKYIGTSIKVGCATHILYASSGPQTIRGDGDQDPVASEEVNCLDIRFTINTLKYTDDKPAP